ncbi:MAG: type II toxin-antitoxin system RelE/ParE family toxin [Thermoflexales bacterium]|nr:type II toxin-antitoxin system RelE/ParE family toxin [Thermoflexales bacterium]
MTAYRVILVASAAKEFRSLPSVLQRRVSVAIDGLSENPRPRGVRKLAGHERLYRIRVGDYRVVYEIDDRERVVRITRIRHRREVYR